MSIEFDVVAQRETLYGVLEKWVILGDINNLLFIIYGIIQYYSFKYHIVLRYGACFVAKNVVNLPKVLI